MTNNETSLVRDLILMSLEFVETISCDLQEIIANNVKIQSVFS